MLNIMDGIVGTDCNLEVGDAEIGQFQYYMDIIGECGPCFEGSMFSVIFG